MVVGSHSGRIRALFDDRGKKVQERRARRIPSRSSGSPACRRRATCWWSSPTSARRGRSPPCARTATRLKGKGVDAHHPRGPAQADPVGRGQGAAAHPQGRRAGLGGGAGRVARAAVHRRGQAQGHPQLGGRRSTRATSCSPPRPTPSCSASTSRPTPRRPAQAQANGVDVRSYNVIYEAINDVKAALAGMLAPEIRETVLGRAQVRQIFVISKLGPDLRLVRSRRARSCAAPRCACRRGDDRARRGHDQLAQALQGRRPRGAAGPRVRHRRRGRQGRPARTTSSRRSPPRRSRARSSAARPARPTCRQRGSRWGWSSCTCPTSDSLKGKRHVLKGLKEKVRAPLRDLGGRGRPPGRLAARHARARLRLRRRPPRQRGRLQGHGLHRGPRRRLRHRHVQWRSC